MCPFISSNLFSKLLVFQLRLVCKFVSFKIISFYVLVLLEVNMNDRTKDPPPLPRKVKKKKGNVTEFEVK